MDEIEYRVRTVTRFVVTCYRANHAERFASSEEKGTYSNAETAYEVAYALCKAEHERLGWPIDDPRISYPRRIVDDSEPPEEG